MFLHHSFQCIPLLLVLSCLEIRTCKPPVLIFVLNLGWNWWEKDSGIAPLATMGLSLECFWCCPEYYVKGKP